MAEVRLVPMTEAQYRHYRESAERNYAESVLASGELSPEDAERKAADDYARVLPEGLATPDSFFFRAYDGDADVGMLWFALSTKADGLRAWIYDIVVDESQRRRGYGRAVMRALEQECRARKVTSIGLNVFGGNDGARSLYEQEGYVATSVQMRKHLD